MVPRNQSRPDNIPSGPEFPKLSLGTGCILFLLLSLLLARAAQAGSLNLAWDAPTTKTDGTPVTDLSVYRVYYGTTSPPCPGPSYQEVSSPTPTPNAGEVISYRLSGLTVGSKYFVQVTAVESDGTEGLCSNTGSGLAAPDPPDTTSPPSPSALASASPPSPSAGDGGGGGGGDCFIATAAYGSPLAAEVQVLRQFRDERLLTHGPGRFLVATYYRLSPPLARVIASHDALRALTRSALQPLIWWTRLALAWPTLALVLGGGGLLAGPLLPLLLRRPWRTRAARSTGRTKP